MSLECAISYLRNAFPDLVEGLSNGQIRFLILENSESDSQGFGNGDFQPLTQNFFDCVWVQRPVKEKEVSLMTRSSSVYEIEIPISPIYGQFDERNRIELKAVFSSSGTTTKTLEIDSIITSGIKLKIIAIDQKQ